MKIISGLNLPGWRTLRASGATITPFGRRRWLPWLGSMLATWVWLIPLTGLAVGTWVPLVHTAPTGINTMLLLSDGTVLGTDGQNGWFRLTPDLQGSYTNGTWTVASPMQDSRLYFSSDVLSDGRLFVAGGEYGTGGPTAEVYDPLSDTWARTPASGANYVDSISEVLPNGNVLVAPVGPVKSDETLIYSPASNAWLAGPTYFHSQDECSWVKLPDNSILTIDFGSTTSERYVPSLNQWVKDAAVPTQIWSTNLGETGPAFLLPNGWAIFLGADGNTALYTPTGTSSPGAWSAGPVISNQQAMADAPGAMMVNGKILCVMCPTNSYGPPTSYYEHDPNADSFTPVNGPNSATNHVAYECRLLDLPDGTVLYSDSSRQLYAYQPDGSPLAAGAPAISGLVTNSDSTYTVTGTLFNGISEGAAYGDDAQMASNYPLIRMTNSAGQVYYCRTFNWSGTGVATGNTPETTQFTVPESAPGGVYSLVVVANGNSSAAVTFAPDALRVSPGTGFSQTASAGAAFSVTNETFSLTNTGGAPLAWSLANTSLWLNVSPSSGSLAAATAGTFSVSLTPAASNLGVGKFSTTVAITNLSSGFVHPLQFALTLPSPPKVTFASPIASEVLLAPATIFVDAFASDPFAEVTNFPLSLNGSVVSTGNGPESSTTLSNLAGGTYTLTATAIDRDGLKATNSIQVLVVSAASADHPIAVTGYNQDVIVERTAIGGNTAQYITQAFDVANNFAFYEAGLNAVNYSGGNSNLEGLPQGGVFTSASDDATVFELGPYIGMNVLFLNGNAPSATLALAIPALYNSISVLATSANGGGVGSFIINFLDGSASGPIGYNAQDWYDHPGGALSHFGRIYSGNFGTLRTDNPSLADPNLYQTTIDLANAGLNGKPIVSLTFSMPDGADTSSETDTGVFALSGTIFLPLAPTIAITNPAAGAVFGAPANFTVIASASTTNGAVTNVEFLVNGTVITNATAAPFGATVSNLSVGTYILSAVAADNNGFKASNSIEVTVINAAQPLAVAGYNQDVVVEHTATGGNTAPYITQAFDAANNYAFYEAGLTADNYSGGNATLEGLPRGGLFTSALDGATVFQLGPYTGKNVLYMNSSSPSGTLALTPPVACASIAILAGSANGGGAGSFIIHFQDGTSSSPMSFNAPDWYNNSGAALTHFGRIYAGNYGVFYTDNPPGTNPNLYQTTLNLAGLGLNSKPIATLTFTMPGGSGTSSATDTGVFAVSGTIQPNVAVTPISLSLTAIVAGQFQFAINGLLPGATNYLQVSTDLSSPANWVTIATNLATTTNLAITEPLGTTNPPVLFFRAVEQP